MHPAIPPLHFSPRERLANAQKEIPKKVVMAALFARAENWRQCNSPSAGDGSINHGVSAYGRRFSRLKLCCMEESPGHVDKAKKQQRGSYTHVRTQRHVTVHRMDLCGDAEGMSGAVTGKEVTVEPVSWDGSEKKGQKLKEHLQLDPAHPPQSLDFLQSEFIMHPCQRLESETQLDIGNVQMTALKNRVSVEFCKNEGIPCASH